jgi:hypothetical protein
MHDLTRASATSPASDSVTTAGCPSSGGCPWPIFLHLVEASTHLR